MQKRQSIADIGEQVREKVFHFEKEQIMQLWKSFFLAKIKEFDSEPMRELLNHIASGIDRLDNLPFYCSLPRREEVTFADLLVVLFQTDLPQGIGVDTEEEMEELRRVMIDKVLIPIYKLRKLKRNV